MLIVAGILHCYNINNIQCCSNCGIKGGYSDFEKTLLALGH